MKNTIGVYGLGVMGSNLARNLLNKGEDVAVYNYTADLTHDFLKKYGHENLQACFDVQEFVASLERPRKILIMVPAGDVTHSVIQQILPFLEKGDIIIDGGNANYLETNQNHSDLKAAGIHLIGLGVSGGEVGALNGPSLMPGGDQEAYQAVARILEKIAAKVDGQACVTYIGPAGAGHYVKTVHNGIEYADMQLITETYHFLRYVVGLETETIADVFSDWQETELESYLLGITSQVLRKKDHDSGLPLIDLILDQAGQKGTGKWSAISAHELGTPATIIDAAVSQRFISALKAERMAMHEALSGPEHALLSADKEKWVTYAKNALLAGRIIAYTQGFMQYQQASKNFNWDLQLDRIAAIFRGGCIIQSQLLNPIRAAYEKDKDLASLFFDDYFQGLLNQHQKALRSFLLEGIKHGLALPAFSNAVAFYDGYRAQLSGAEMIQAQRDYFGAHTYERIDKSGIFHTQW